ncbi:MAG: dynamin family protein, partial [Myxococcales bacterium]|nr:dynamin family protein [Myxococcales bacterium]
ALLAERADDGLGLAGAAMACRAESPEQALDLAARAVTAGETFAGRLALGTMELERGHLREAQVALRAALRAKPRSPRARALLLRAYREQAAGTAAAAASDDETSAERGFVASLRRLSGLLSSRPLLEDLSPAVARVQADVDRPLLVAVMGEFNSGKSTFVNALIGEEIAPMGVRPTTATINVLKYGAERAARVIYRDDREETLGWDDVGPFLRGLDNSAARAVHVVELLYPAEELLRVNVVDTPGLNSMIDEHEQTAREYIEQADAIIWLFSAQQAGKDSEQAALELIERQKLKTVGVLNKVDHLSEQDLAQVLRHLEQGFGALCETIAAVAARPALDALTHGDQAALDKSRFPALRALLEERIFSRSRRIKREASARKLAGICAEARRRLEAALQPVADAREQVATLEQTLRDARALDARIREREALDGALDRLYREAAHEVLEFVRPRRWYFGQHRASRADRDFLIELLEERLVTLADGVVGRTRADLLAQGRTLQSALARHLTGRALGALSHHTERVAALVSERRALLEQVAARFRAYVRGFLAGGRVDHFFEHQLPKLELELKPAERALREREVDVDLELLVPLSEWHEATTAALVAALVALREVIAVLELELDEAALAPLHELEQALR